jgi:PX domain
MIKTSKKIQFKVSITGHSQEIPEPDPDEKSTSNKKVTFYTISITSPIRNWKVKHRYSDFHNLHENLSKCYTKLPKVPGKTFFAVTSESKIEKRQQELERYLTELVELDLLMSNVYSCKFFQIEDHFPEYFCRPPEVLAEYETVRNLTFTDVNYEPGRLVNYLLCSKGIDRPANSVKSKGDPVLATVAEGSSKSLLNGFKFSEYEATKLFQDKKVVKSFDMKAHCLQYFAEASILVAGFSQGIISVYKEEKKNKLDDEYQLSGVAKLKVSSDRVTKILMNTSKGQMYIFGRKNQVKIVDMAQWEVKDTFKIGVTQIHSPVIDEDHEMGLSTTEEGELLVWNITPAHPVLAQKISIAQGAKIKLMDCDLDAGKVFCVAENTGQVYLLDIEFPFTYVGKLLSRKATSK